MIIKGTDFEWDTDTRPSVFDRVKAVASTGSTSKTGFGV